MAFAYVLISQVKPPLTKKGPLAGTGQSLVVRSAGLLSMTAVTVRPDTETGLHSSVAAPLRVRRHFGSSPLALAVISLSLRPCMAESA